MNIDDAKALAVRSIHIMGNGTLEEFHEVVHPEFLNHEAKDEPPAARERGPAGCYATALWLRDAFEDLRWEIGEVVAEGDLIAVHCTMKGRHTRRLRRLRRGRQGRPGVPADRPHVRQHADALAADRRRPGDRALGQPRRPRHGAATRLGAADPALSGPRAVRQAQGRPARGRRCLTQRRRQVMRRLKVG